MSDTLSPLATAAAEILATRQQQTAAKRQEADDQENKRNNLTLAHFWLRYPALVELLKSSGIVVTTETSDDEDGWSNLVFSSPNYQPLRLLVTNYATDESLINNFAIGGRAVQSDELVTRLDKYFTAGKAEEGVVATPGTEVPAGKSPGYYLGKEPAFPQRAEDEGQPQGLTKLEYLAAGNMKTLVEQSEGGQHYAELGTRAVQMAQALLDSLAEAK